MKKIILIILMLVSINSFSQTDSTKIQETVRTMKSDIVFRGSMGVFSHTLGSLALMEGKPGDPGRYQSFILYNSVGVMFDTFAIIKWAQLRKYKKKHKLIKTSYR